MVKSTETLTPAERRRQRDERQRVKDERAEARRAAIREIMEHRGLSQKEWCDMAGLENSSALGNFLGGHTRSLNLETLEPLARSIGLTVSQLIGEETPASAVEVSGGARPETMRVTLESVENDNFRLTTTVEVDMPHGIERLLRVILGKAEPAEQ